MEIKTEYADFEIRVGTKDEGGEESDGLYFAFLAGFYVDGDGDGGWCNTGIVAREATPEDAFMKVLEIAKKKGFWS